MTTSLHVVTGALGYSGKAIAKRLLARGHRVRTLTNSPHRPNPFGDSLEIHQLAWSDPARLTNSLRGADTLVNTYWVRFNHKHFTFDEAVANTKALFRAAHAAGVRRIIHVSILKPDEGAALGLAYYQGKAELERDLRTLGVPHAILRPGVLFGRGDVLVNNIAWALRRLPVFGVFGRGDYELEPMHVDDFADLAVSQACADHTMPSATIDAKGPERFTFRGLAETLRSTLALRTPIMHVPASMGYIASKILGPLVGDVVLTREEIAGLMAGLLASDAPPTGPTGLTEWARQHAATLGTRYASEVGRRIERTKSYE
jgi:uncharacterized protein YbjT (DUF2867 family)